MSINIKDNIMEPELNRTYEISLWTLQDSFIAVLGDSSSQYRGYIQEPTMVLSNDGTQELDFKLPMYIDDGVTRRKSNIWAQMTNAVTIAGMRKIKVIFNKNTEDQAIYEFIITRVTDTHEQNQPMCEVHCEGLAFHELGKIGYKINLSREEYEADNQAAWDSMTGSTIEEQISSVPQPTIDYWCKKIGLTPYPSSSAEVNSALWYYRITMDWTAFSSGYMRQPGTIYEEAYISSYDDEKLTPISYTVYQEKQRFVESSGSNIYNLTQDIAKTFGVYCRYDYDHDTNFHITGRIVTFYNNFIDEKDRIEFTYPYTTKSITRENDCTDLVTKMYVNTVESNQSATGLISIMDNPVNPTGEDYLLNFDYLYSIGTITDEQYKYIKEFSIQVKQLNTQILALQEELVRRETVEVIYNAQLQVLENVLIEDQEQIETYKAYIEDLTSDGKLDRTLSDGTTSELYVISGEVSFVDDGVLANTIKVYNVQNNDAQITNFNVVFNESNARYAIGLSNLEGYTSVKVAYDYYPALYYNEVKELYEKRMDRDQRKYDALYDKIQTITQEMGEANIDISSHITLKNELLKKFERIMGPALREGNWTPEDYSNVANASYQFAGTIQESSTLWNSNDPVKIINGTISNPNGKLIFDSYLNYDDVDVRYLNEESSTSPYYVLPITAEQGMTWISDFYGNQANKGCPYGLVWWDDNYSQNNRPSPVVKSIILGAECECAFIYNSNKIQPVLVLTDLDEHTLANINTNSSLFLCGIKTVYENNQLEIIKIDPHEIEINQIILAPDGYIAHTLRFRVNDYSMLTDENNLKIWYGTQLLKEFEDYSVTQVVNTQQIDADNKGYDITFNTLSILRLWSANKILKINYACSQLSTAIYLDAVQILKENAYPKVTYSVDPNLIYDTFFYTDYKALNKIAFINDNELEFDQVQGYISSVNLNLDKPWEDTIEVKNYKNKFEDIFSTIVAQTESMEKNEAIITNMSNSINTDGSISSTNLIQALAATTLTYASTTGSLNISKNVGILSVGDAGAITLRSGGLSVATGTTNSGEWAWKKIITPSGISASGITSGNIALDKVKLISDNSNLIINNNQIKSNTLFIEDGILISGVLSIYNGQLTLIDNAILSSEYDAVQLLPATSNAAAQLKVNNKNNLIIGNQDIQSYIEDIASNFLSRPWGSSFQRSISISNIDVGQVSSDRSVFVGTDRLRLGRNSVYALLYYDFNSSNHTATLSIGSVANPVIQEKAVFNSAGTTLTSAECTIAGWKATANDGLIKQDLNDNIISQISHDVLQIDDYIKTFVEGSGNTTGHAVRIKKLYLNKGDNDTDHIITFINSGTNYLLKINSEGLHYSLDNGTTWNTLAIVTPEEPEPEP